MLNSSPVTLLNVSLHTFEFFRRPTYRLGCYRYQDVPTVPTEGLLCLLWDVPEGQCRRVIESLRNRSLVEFNNAE